MVTEELADKINAISSGFAKNTDAINTNFGTIFDRLERIEARRDLPRGVGGGHYSREDDEYKSVFLEWMRKPTDPRREGRLSEAQHELGKKDVSIASNPGGGYAVPKEISASIESRVRQLNPFRDLVDVVQTGTSDFHSLVSIQGTTGWVSETATRTATQTPNLRDVQPTMGEQYSLLTASNWSLQGLFFNVSDWLVGDAAADFAGAEATAIISGNGSSRPTGFLASTPVTTTDFASPMRAAGVLQYIPLNGYGSPVGLTFDSFIDLVATVSERYLMENDRCAFVMTDSRGFKGKLLALTYTARHALVYLCRRALTGACLTFLMVKSLLQIASLRNGRFRAI